MVRRPRPLLNELATEKLRAAADGLTARWKWAEAALEADWSAIAGFGRISPEPGVPTEEEKAERESLRARHDELVNMDEDEWTDELIEEAEAIEARLRAIDLGIEARAASGSPKSRKTFPLPSTSSNSLSLMATAPFSVAPAGP